jgi:hypothetical protein
LAAWAMIKEQFTAFCLSILPLVTTFAYGPGGPSSSSETSLIVSGIFELPLTNLNKLAKFG